MRIWDFIDPNTHVAIPKEGPYDIGHKKGQSWAKRKQEHIENKPNLYQIEDPKSNRSRRYD